MKQVTPLFIGKINPITNHQIYAISDFKEAVQD